VAVVLVVFIAGFIFWATHHETDHWAITPGVAQPVGPLITVEGHHTATGRSIFLTDVYLTQLNEWQYLLAQIHPVNEQLIPTSDLTVVDTPLSQLSNQAYLQMYDSRNDARAAAMRALHLKVTGTPDGATVVGTVVNSPAENAVNVGDRIVAVDGRRISDACGVAGVLNGVQPGSTIVLAIVPASISAKGAFSFGKERDVRVRAGVVPSGEAATNCPNAPRATAGLGVLLEDSTDWHFPVGVSINTNDIGGPSAGLAMTLGIIEALSKTSLTGHLRIAATGTIDPQGGVGDVGGVAEKAIAVVRAGATVFFVPLVEVGAANSTERSSLRVIGVTSLSQVLADLRRLVGTTSGPIADTSSRRATS
jgi:PDZ domain-containing protein